MRDNSSILYWETVWIKGIICGDRKHIPELGNTRREGMEKENGFTLKFTEFSLLLNNLSI